MTPRRGSFAALRLAALLVATLAALLAGCAATPAAAPAEAAGAASAPAPAAPVMGRHPADPWEALNRQMFAFNDALDEVLLKPAGTAYRDFVPPLVRQGVNNVFSNIDDIWSVANLFLQGKVQYGLEMSMRFMTNSFFGVGGLFDVASDMGLVRRREDFGQTLGRWGFDTGPYLVLPLFGPRNVRDTVGLLVDRQGDPDKWLDVGDGRWLLFGLEVVAIRADLLAAGALFDQIAIDRYAMMRDAYLARRRDLVYDGSPPLEPMDTDEATDPEAAPPPPARSPASAPGAPASAPAR